MRFSFTAFTLLAMGFSTTALAQSAMNSTGISTTGYVYAATVSATNFRGDGSLLTNLPVGYSDRLVSGTATLIQNNTGTLVQTAGGNGNFNMTAAGSNAIQLGDGRTTNNYAYLDLIGDATYSDYGLRVIRDNVGANSSSWLQHRGTGPLTLHTTEAAPIVFNTTSLERMRILAGGNVGIGIVAPSYPLDVSGSARATAFLYSSDKRLKENLTPLDTTLSQISTLKPYRYTYISDTAKTPRIGLIAQDVEKVFPEAVQTDANGLKSVDYPALVPALFKAVQDLQKEVETLKAQANAAR